jgi:CheY-specific phosphatase CheX
LVPEKLNPQQQLSLNKTIQAALDRAAASLKTMLGGEISIGLAPAALRPSGVSVSLGLTGALEGGIYIDMPEKLAVEIVKTLSAGRDLSLLDETARSILMELGNILASVFVGYFDQNRGLRILPTPPELSLVPHEVPDFAGVLSAEFFWSKCHERAEVIVGLERSALDILLAG